MLTKSLWISFAVGVSGKHFLSCTCILQQSACSAVHSVLTIAFIIILIAVENRILYFTVFNYSVHTTDVILPSKCVYLLVIILFCILLKYKMHFIKCRINFFCKSTVIIIMYYALCNFVYDILCIINYRNCMRHDIVYVLFIRYNIISPVVSSQSDRIWD